MIDFEHRHQSNSNLFYLFKHVGQVNLMMLALKSGPKIAAKIGNPAGLLCRQIWYSVRKSGVLGITEYHQGRPQPLNGYPASGDNTVEPLFYDHPQNQIGVVVK